jgi:hypothetical protein
MAIFNSYVKLPEGSSKPFEKKPSDFSTASTASEVGKWMAASVA